MRLSMFLVWTTLLLTCCGTVSASTYNAFTDPQTVTIEGYSGSAMEPFIARDGDYLLFNVTRP